MRGRPRILRPRLRWGQKPWYAEIHLAALAAGIALTIIPALVAAAVLTPRASAHPGTTAAAHAAAAPALPVVEPTPPAPPPLLSATEVAAAAKRPAASAPLSRLPQVDLNGLQVGGIPRAALKAYVTGAKLANAEDPSCHVRFWLLAGIGFVESGHAHSGGSAAPTWNGIAKPGIYGPVLDGSGGFGQIPDSDGGKLDGNKKWDRAVGPMQFLPSTWARWGTDAHGKMRDPQDIRAAALAAGRYLCASSADLSTPAGMASAVYSYNHSWAYVHLVLSVAARYAGLDPKALGVDRLPKDKPAKDDKHKKKDKTKKAKAKGAAKPSASPAPAANGGKGSPSQSPSPSPSGSSSPSPSPSSSPAGGAPSGGPSLPPILRPGG